MKSKKLLNEHFQPLDEDMKYMALAQLREIQSNLVGISFLPVIAIMKQDNPLKKDVIKFQDDLDAVTIAIQNFISKAKNDVDYTEPEEPEEIVPDKDGKTKDSKDTEDDEDDKKIEDTTEPGE